MGPPPFSFLLARGWVGFFSLLQAGMVPRATAELGGAAPRRSGLCQLPASQEPPGYSLSVSLGSMSSGQVATVALSLCQARPLLRAEKHLAGSMCFWMGWGPQRPCAARLGVLTLAGRSLLSLATRWAAPPGPWPGLASIFFLTVSWGLCAELFQSLVPLPLPSTMTHIFLLGSWGQEGKLPGLPPPFSPTGGYS